MVSLIAVRPARCLEHPSMATFAKTLDRHGELVEQLEVPLANVEQVSLVFLSENSEVIPRASRDSSYVCAIMMTPNHWPDSHRCRARPGCLVDTDTMEGQTDPGFFLVRRSVSSLTGKIDCSGCCCQCRRCKRCILVEALEPHRGR